MVLLPAQHSTAQRSTGEPSARERMLVDQHVGSICQQLEGRRVTNLAGSLRAEVGSSRAYESQDKS
jgi:hypothetical protein